MPCAYSLTQVLFFSGAWSIFLPIGAPVCSALQNNFLLSSPSSSTPLLLVVSSILNERAVLWSWRPEDLNRRWECLVYPFCSRWFPRFEPVGQQCRRQLCANWWDREDSNYLLWCFARMAGCEYVLSAAVEVNDRTGALESDVLKLCSVQVLTIGADRWVIDHSIVAKRSRPIAAESFVDILDVWFQGNKQSIRNVFWLFRLKTGVGFEKKRSQVCGVFNVSLCCVQWLSQSSARKVANVSKESRKLVSWSKPACPC